jgi:hypothetical protein
MKIKQISVFLENRKGRLFEVCSLLEINKVNIRAMNIAETESFGILRLVVDKPEAAVAALKEHNVTADISDVVAVEVKDEPGGLAKILKVLSDNNINIEYVYGFVEKFKNAAMLVFRFEDPKQAADILTKNSIRVVTEKELRGL